MTINILLLFIAESPPSTDTIHRLQSINTVRGLVMVMMAQGHVREFSFHHLPNNRTLDRTAREAQKH